MTNQEQEDLIRQNQDLFILENMLKENPLELINEHIPGILHVNKLDDFAIQFLNNKGCEMYGHELEEIQMIGSEIFDRYTHQDTIEKEFPKVGRFIQLDDKNGSAHIYQKVKFYQKKEYQWVYTTFKFLKNTNCLIGLSHPVNEMGSIGNKLKRLLDENDFLRKNFLRFSSLTKREKEILKLIVQGQTNKIIATQLFVSEHTIRTHRNRIWKKLDIKTLSEAIKYGNSFDLI